MNITCQSANKFQCWSGKVGNRPPGGCVGEIADREACADSSAAM